jgi:hypothetical protein
MIDFLKTIHVPIGCWLLLAVLMIGLSVKALIDHMDDDIEED